MVEDTTTVTLDGTDYDIKPANEDDFVNLVLGMDDVLPLARGDSETFETVGGTTVSIDTTIDPDDDRLEEELDKARAEGFAAGLFFGSSIAFEMGMMSPLVGMFTDLESLYPEVEDDLFDGTQDVAVEETMFEKVSVDENEIIRELEGVDTSEAARKRIERTNHEILSHCGSVVTASNDKKGELYVATDYAAEVDDFEVPEGWEAIDEGHGITFSKK